MKKNHALLFLSILVTSFLHAAPELLLVSPAENAVVPLLTEQQKSYLDKPRAERVALFADASFRQTMKSWGYYPAKVRLAWTWKDESGVRPKFTVQVFRKPDNVPVFLTDTVEHEVELDNLEIAREYGWMVVAQQLGQVVSVAMGNFTTEDRAPRLVRIPGVPNVRDLGGRIGLDGRRVRQGLILRTAGLNENASTLYYTPEEVLELDDTWELREAIGAAQKKLAEAEKLRDRSASEPRASATLSSTWTVFRPEGAAYKAMGAAELRRMTSIPKTFLGAAAETFTADAHGAIEFPASESGAAKAEPFEHPAVFVQEIEADRDGWLGLGCGADWYWELRVDGEVVFDRTNGNNKGGKTSDDWRLPVRVTKGRHLLAATVYSGSVAWSWCCATKPEVSTRDLFDTYVDQERHALESLARIPKGTLHGRNRLTVATRGYMLNTLGMKSDIDLRSDGECFGMRGSPMGPTVTWHHISSSSYAGMQEEGGRAAFKKVFRIFLDPTQYPIDFHCIAGQDRTGAVAFILNALLGVSEEELYLDWESTGFWNPDTWFSHKNLFDNLVKGFDRWPGETIHARVEAYVKSLGFTDADIASLRELLLEPAP